MSAGIDIPRIVSELKKVSVYQVLQETITNSIDANATQIDLFVDVSRLNKDMPWSINSLKLIDNGDGFNKKTRIHLTLIKALIK